MSQAVQATSLLLVERLAADLNDKRLELPAFPDSVVRIQQTIRDERKDIDDVVAIVSSDPALAARFLQLANSAAMRTGDAVITDVRAAVLRLGLKLVSCVAVSFATRQLERNDGYSPEDRARLEGIWKDSLDVASICHVLAKRFTRVAADEALLTGLLHVLGHLYVFLRAHDEGMELTPEELDSIAEDWHPAIAKAIAESWGMSEGLVAAMEQQKDFDTAFRGATSPSEMPVIEACRHSVGRGDSGFDRRTQR